MMPLFWLKLSLSYHLLFKIALSLSLLSAPLVPAELSGRVIFQPHDFFTPQPVKADVYIVKQISMIGLSSMWSRFWRTLRPTSNLVVAW
jgi:hypothetical protein